MRSFILLKKENSITGQGHTLAMSAAASKLSPTAAFHHDTSGMQGIRKLRQLRDNLLKTNDYSAILEKFDEIHQALLLNQKQILLIAEPHFEDKLTDPLNNLWEEESTAQSSSFNLPPTRKHISGMDNK